MPSQIAKSTFHHVQTALEEGEEVLLFGFAKMTDPAGLIPVAALSLLAIFGIIEIVTKLKAGDYFSPALAISYVFTPLLILGVGLASKSLHMTDGDPWYAMTRCAY